MRVPEQFKVIRQSQYFAEIDFGICPPTMEEADELATAGLLVTFIQFPGALDVDQVCTVTVQDLLGTMKANMSAAVSEMA